MVILPTINIIYNNVSELDNLDNETIPHYNNPINLNYIVSYICSYDKDMDYYTITFITITGDDSIKWHFTFFDDFNTNIEKINNHFRKL